MSGSIKKYFFPKEVNNQGKTNLRRKRQAEKDDKSANVSKRSNVGEQEIILLSDDEDGDKESVSASSELKCTKTFSKFGRPLLKKGEKSLSGTPPSKVEHKGAGKRKEVSNVLTKLTGNSPEKDVFIRPKRVSKKPRYSASATPKRSENKNQIENAQVIEYPPPKRSLSETAPLTDKDAEISFEDFSNNILGGKTNAKDAHKINIPLAITNTTENRSNLNQENLTEKSKSSNLEHLENEGSVSDGKKSIYLNNFMLVLNSVMANKMDLKLFKGQDANLISNFTNLDLSCQELYVRLYQRKIQWIAADKIVYKHISDDLSYQLNILTSQGFLECSVNYDYNESSLMSVEELLYILPLNKAKILSKYLNICCNTKWEIVRFVTDLCKKRQTGFFSHSGPSVEVKIKAKLNNLLGPCYRINLDSKKVFDRCMIVFDALRDIMHYSTSSSVPRTPGSHQSFSRGPSLLSNMLRAGISTITYPNYEIYVTTPLFHDREELLEYEKACCYLADIRFEVENSKYDNALELCAKAEEDSKLLKKPTKCVGKVPKFARRYSPLYVYFRIKCFKFEIYQKLRDYTNACSVLRELLLEEKETPKRGYWYERLALNLEQHLKKPASALEVIAEGLADLTTLPSYYVSLSERMQKLKKNKDSLSICIDKAITTLLVPQEKVVSGQYLPNRSKSSKPKFIKQNSETEEVIICSVEELALDYYKEQGFPKGLHAEGSTFLTLFSLLMWDIIYVSGVPNVFRNSYQSLPLDFMSEDFYLSREMEVDKRLKQIEKWVTPEFNCNAHIRDIWNENVNTECGSLNWDLFSSPNAVSELCRSIGSKVLARVFRKFTCSPGFTRSGMPDLVVWDPSGPKAKIVEVKGPGDQLFAKQKVWIHTLLSFGADVEVCRIEARASTKI